MGSWAGVILALRSGRRMPHERSRLHRWRPMSNTVLLEAEAQKWRDDGGWVTAEPVLERPDGLHGQGSLSVDASPRCRLGRGDVCFGWDQQANAHGLQRRSPGSRSRRRRPALDGKVRHTAAPHPDRWTVSKPHSHPEPQQRGPHAHPDGRGGGGRAPCTRWPALMPPAGTCKTSATRFFRIRKGGIEHIRRTLPLAERSHAGSSSHSLALARVPTP